MTQDSEKRFHSIMDKLFQTTQPPTPNSNSTSSPSASPSGVQSSRGKKRPYSSSALVYEWLRPRGDAIEAFQPHSSAPAGSSDAPLCRPWDRSDLLKRLSTFKSMTWFGKPKVVSADNCARRGWINVDMDTLACKSCGARLLFTTPSSWNQQQVEKAALVFSLKLDSGHKLQCPWIDNACDETLADFPPTPPPILVDRFRERCSMLLNLSAVPVISSSFIKRMKNPNLEHFLDKSCLLDFGDAYLNKSEIEYLGNGNDSGSAEIYYQALKLISLFGWEPRSLPYVVDCKTESNQSIKASCILDSSLHIVNLHPATNENVKGNRIAEISSELQPHPNSVALDCKLCGASVGLWAFNTAPRPMEIIRLVGQIELNSESGTHEGNKSCITPASIGNLGALPREGISSLTSTIAGGPTPARQNFKATITLPVIGQNLRARLFNDIEYIDFMYSDREMVQSSSQDNSLLLDSENNKEARATELIAQPEDMRLLQNRTLDHGCSISNDTPMAGANVTEQGTLPESGLHSSTKETLVESRENVPLQKIEILDNAGGQISDSVKSDCANKAGEQDPHPSPANEGEQETLVERRENVPVQEIEMLDKAENSEEVTKNSGKLDPANKAGEQDPHPSSIEHPVTTTSLIENELPFISDNCDLQHSSENGTSNSKEAFLANSQLSPYNSSSREVSTKTDIPRKDKLTESELSSDNRTTSGNQVKDKVQTSMNCELLTHSRENYLKEAPLDKVMEFNPLAQHRPFCPWIATGNSAPGWKQTLTALQRQKGSSSHSPKNSPSAYLIKVDDPVKSVRNLFTSSAKKLKRSISSSGSAKRL